jgi:formylglycine-generating enzyme required for sulfatase activity
MGSVLSEQCFEQPFWIDRYEISNARYGSTTQSPDCRPASSALDQPRNCVSLSNAMAHCEDRGARLPTEVEWEYAARGPENLTYPWGDEFIEDNVVYNGNANTTANVGSRPDGASWVGALDMSGNIAEWTSTIYENGREEPENTSAARAIRGGSFLDGELNIRTVSRYENAPGTVFNSIGFRCARDFAEAESFLLPGSGVSLASIAQNADWSPVFQIIDGVEMALVPPGCFMMGNVSGEEDEGPTHEQCFEQPFWIDRYEVTNGQYGNVGCSDRSSEPNQPRNCVNWFDSTAHCEDRGARLPTEAEWEYAARGGVDGLKYPWGNDRSHDQANYWRTGGQDHWKHTAPIGSFPPNTFGLHDMAGNVYEWVGDWFSEDYYGASPAADPKGPPKGRLRVARGGAGFLNPAVLRISTRLRSAPDTRNITVGLRCAADEKP